MWVSRVDSCKGDSRCGFGIDSSSRFFGGQDECESGASDSGEPEDSCAP